MSTYEWPPARKLPDDARGRRAFLAPRRADFDPDGARQAARAAPPAPAPGPGHAPAAPASGRTNLWVPLGPATIIGGQAAGAPRVAGRINALALSDNGQRIYAASANGGVWYSDNAGTSWRSLGGLAATTVGEITRPSSRNAIGTITLRPGGVEASEDVFVGTGEPYDYHRNMVGGQPGRSLGGIGILVAQGPARPGQDNPWLREASNLVGEAVYRIALQPGGSGIVAATTVGLLRRPNPLPANGHWERVPGDPLADIATECTDVLWTAAAGTRPERLWVWVRAGEHPGLWVQDGGTGNFRHVVTAGSVSERAVLAASTPANQVWVFHDRTGAGPALYRVSSVDGSLPVATRVQGVPNILKTQGFYDIAIAVHPTLPNRVVLGGSWIDTSAPDTTLLTSNYDGAVVSADVAVNGAGTLTFGHPTPFVTVGVGAHADVHDVRFASAGARLWLACDGGIYRSDAPTGQVGFVSCNTGLAVAESNYTISHPTCEGFLVAGLQDNGVIQRLSSGVWHSRAGGDGGGIVLDPLQPGRWLQQYVLGSWSASDASIEWGSPLSRGGVVQSATENTDASFYSSAASISYRRAAPPPADHDVRQIILGTTRLWYTDDFGQNWFTLPTGTDPLAAPPVNTAQDDLGEAITVCRWQGPDAAWVLTDGLLARYSRTPGTDALNIPGNWAAIDVVARRGTSGKKDRKSATGPMRSAAMWTDLAVNLETPIRGTRGAVYLGTIGSATNTEIDTLWWFDGTATWHPTRLRNQVPAPVTAIACDPAHPEEVWVGTTVGVWRGIRTLNGANPPTWAWSARVNGLPEAPVEDLSIFSDGGLRLLRAAIASRGLWELRLDVADVTDLTYLRAHDDDLRYRARAVEFKRDTRTRRSWHGSPDVRPRVASAPRAEPALPWQRGRFGGDVEGLRRFQAALRSSTGDARVRSTGAWDNYFNEVLRAHAAPNVPPPPPPPPPKPNNIGIDHAFWIAHMVAPHASADPWGAGPPTEEDLYELSAELVEGDLGQTSCRLPAGRCKVDVVVHHRGLDARPGADVRVTLLRWIDIRPAGRARWNSSANWVPGNVTWAPAVNDLLNSAAGTTALTFAGGWRFAETTVADRRRTLAGQTLDATRSGVVTFDLDLSGLLRNTVVILAAVIRAGSADVANNINLAPAALKDLALNSPNVAVRSIRIGT